MSTIEKAIAIAADVHAGQVDRGGHPYILHPLQVMFRMSTMAEKIAAVLHDAPEDSSEGSAAVMKRLASEGFDKDVLAAVEALTKRKGETRLSAAHRAAANEIARNVKLADNLENSDLSRISAPDAEDLKRLEEYKQVRAVLLKAGAVLK